MISNVKASAAAKTKPTSFKLTSSAKADMHALAAWRYGQRGIARWIERSISKLMLLPDIEIVVRCGYDEDGLKFDELQSIRLTVDAVKHLKDGIRKVRQLEPTREGVIGEVLRAAVVYGIECAQERGDDGELAALDFDRLQRLPD